MRSINRKLTPKGGDGYGAFLQDQFGGLSLVPSKPAICPGSSWAQRLPLDDEEGSVNAFRTQRRRSEFSAPIEIPSRVIEDRPNVLFSRRFGHAYVALQALFNREKKVFGYEILHRSGRENRFDGDVNQATQSIMRDWAFHELHDLADGHPIFLNCPRQVLVDRVLGGLATPVVIEVLETVEPDEEVIAACRRLKDLGYQIALDDFQLSDQIGALVELADYIKVDFRLSDRQERAKIHDYLGGRPVTLVAEKIETADEFEEAILEGFHLLQGYYIAEPVVCSKSSRHF